jgi:NAD(P)-dependent dehydrogenase (short-subunit alcohol dehydrogenase family)
VSAFAGDGWRVFAGVRSDEAARRLSALGGSVTPIELELTDDESVARAGQAVAEAVGPGGLDALVNNAGLIVQGPLELVPAAALRRQFEVNVIGQVTLTQALLPLLRLARGRVVNISAISGRVAVPMAAPISASKAALESLSDALRMELRHQGVSVSVVEPGAIATEIFDKSARAGEADGYAGDPATQALYAPAIETTRAALERMKPSPVDGVVRAVTKALTARRPRSRYLVGRDARAVAMLRKLPEGARDRALMSATGLRRDAFAGG